MHILQGKKKKKINEVPMFLLALLDLHKNKKNKKFCKMLLAKRLFRQYNQNDYQH